MKTRSYIYTENIYRASLTITVFREEKIIWLFRTLSMENSDIGTVKNVLTVEH